MMHILDDLAILQAVCRDQRKWGIMAHFQFAETLDPAHWRTEIVGATNGLVDITREDQFWVGNALALYGQSVAIYLLFDSREEMEEAFFHRIYGDDNSEDHEYGQFGSGALHTIRCVTCTPAGVTENENS